MSKVAGAILERLAALATSATAKVIAATDSAVSLVSYATTTTANALVQTGAGGTIDKSFLPAPSTTTAGSITPARLPQGRYYAPQIAAAGGNNTRNMVVGTLNASFCPQVSADTYSAIAIHVTTAAAAGKKLRLAVYTNDTNGFPGALIWYSADTVCDTTLGVYSLTFASGTWVDTTYKTGNNLTVPFGSAVWMASESDGVPTVRGTLAANCFPICFPAATFATGNNYMTVANTFGSGSPNPFGTPTEASGNVPCVALLVV